jgi:thioredoxin-dependent peroxiredoxin
MEERIGEAHELGTQLTVLGRKLQPGDKAPDFSLEHYDGTTLKTVCLSDSAGAVRLLNVVNSLDTPVCHIETRRWEGLRHQLPSSVQLLTISMDLPYAQARWQTAECVMHPTLSAHKTEQFGHDYGVLIKEWRLLQRAVFVIDADGCVVHAEYVPDQMREPDYSAAMSAIHSVLGSGK